MSDTAWMAVALLVLALVVGWLAWEMRQSRAPRTSLPPERPKVERVPRRRG